MGKAKIIFYCLEATMFGVPIAFDNIPNEIGYVLIAGSIIGVILTFLWPIDITFLKKKAGKRISFLDLAKLAHKEGWDMMEDSLEVVNLKDALLQSAIDGLITIKGRPRGNPYSEKFTKNAPLEEVPHNYFSRCNLGTLYIYTLKEGTTKIKGFSNDNYQVYLQTSSDTEITYQDIHIENRNIKKWMQNAKKEYQGRRQKTR